MANVKMYRDRNEDGDCVTIYINDDCYGTFLENDETVKCLEQLGIEINEGLDNR